jgi:hypothetical protein
VRCRQPSVLCAFPASPSRRMRGKSQ